MLPCTDGDYKRGERFGLAAGAGREAQSRILLRLGCWRKPEKYFCARGSLSPFFQKRHGVCGFFDGFVSGVMVGFLPFLSAFIVIFYRNKRLCVVKNNYILNFMLFFVFCGFDGFHQL